MYSHPSGKPARIKPFLRLKVQGSNPHGTFFLIKGLASFQLASSEALLRFNPPEVLLKLLPLEALHLHSIQKYFQYFYLQKLQASNVSTLRSKLSNMFLTPQEAMRSFSCPETAARSSQKPSHALETASHSAPETLSHALEASQFLILQKQETSELFRSPISGHFQTFFFSKLLLNKVIK